MFGPLEVRLEGRRLGGRDFDGVKPKQLLEVLLLEQGRFVPKERAADLLWGERPPRRAAATIETYVSLLRRLDSGSNSRPAPDPHGAGGYRLAADALEVDLDSYEALLRQAAVAAPADRRTLETAVEIGRLDLRRARPYASWVIPTREHYRERQVQALVDLAECCLDLGDHGADRARRPSGGSGSEARRPAGPCPQGTRTIARRGQNELVRHPAGALLGEVLDSAGDLLAGQRVPGRVGRVAGRLGRLDGRVDHQQRHVYPLLAQLLGRRLHQRARGERPGRPQPATGDGTARETPVTCTSVPPPASRSAAAPAERKAKDCSATATVQPRKPSSEASASGRLRTGPSRAAGSR